VRPGPVAHDGIGPTQRKGDGRYFRVADNEMLPFECREVEHVAPVAGYYAVGRARRFLGRGAAAP
jgi:hypothetical protein